MQLCLFNLNQIYVQHAATATAASTTAADKIKLAMAAVNLCGHTYTRTCTLS